MSKQVADMISAEAEPRDEDSPVRIVSGQTFRRAGEVWTQHGYREDSRTRKILVGSDDYFALLRAHPRLGAVFALGARVIFEVDGTWYETAPKR